DGAAQHHSRGGDGTHASQSRWPCAIRNAFLGKENVMSRISKHIISRLVVLGLATSIGALGLAASAADPALAAKGGGRGGGGGGGACISMPPILMPRTLAADTTPQCRIIRTRRTLAAATITHTSRIRATRIRPGLTPTRRI